MNVSIVEEVTGIEVIEAKASDIVTQASGPIVDQASYDAGAEVLKAIKGLRKEIETTFKPAIDAAHKAHKTVIEAMKKHDKPLEDAEGKLKKALAAWYSEQERIAREKAIAAQKEAEALAKANEALGLDEPVMQTVQAPSPVA